ncbi:MAG: hypothetical protein P1P65_03085 [Treponema sp.]
MKKTIAAAAAVLLIIIASCKNPPIFAAIEQEVKLKPASVKGFVSGIVKIRGTLYTSNGKIFQKSFGTTGKWSELSTPGGRSLSIASDGTKLYAVFENNGSCTAYVHNGGWQPIDAPIRSVAGTEKVFGSDGNNIYRITDTNAVSLTGVTGALKGAAKNYFLLETGLYKDNGTRIEGTNCPSGGLKGICDGPDNSVLIFDNSTVHCYNGTGWTSIAHGVSSPLSITYLPVKQLVLVSGRAGFGEIKLATPSSVNLNGARRVSAGSADSAVPPGNYYQYKNSVGKWYLNPIAAFDNRSGYIIYTGVLDNNTKYSGLWGFYYPVQIEWNRE